MALLGLLVLLRGGGRRLPITAAGGDETLDGSDQEQRTQTDPSQAFRHGVDLSSLSNRGWITAVGGLAQAPSRTREIRNPPPGWPRRPAPHGTRHGGPRRRGPPIGN